MKLTYLGTAAAEGIPALFCECDICRYAQEKGGRNLRMRASAIIDQTILIDFPPDMLTAKMRYNLNLASVEAVFFTHSHIDHLASKELCYYHGMYSNRINPLSVLRLYGNEKVLDTIRQDFVFDMETLPDCVALHWMEPFRPVTIGSTRVTALPARHDPREECLIYLIEQPGARLLYANDTAMPPDETLDFLQGRRLDAVSLDCTTGRFPCGTVHMGFPDNLALRRRLMALNAADERTRFISHHFSHNGRVNYDDFGALAAGSGFESSYDGMEIVL
jgi:phosphoribosyl 1,2-cyclic phosphate phosphodiesterase